MGLNSAGVGALLASGNEAVIWVAMGDGPTAADQTSDQRRLLVSTAAGGAITATGTPYAYTGSPGAPATHALLFSAETGGTFYGNEIVPGDQVYDGSGDFSLAALSISGVMNDSAITLNTAGITALLDAGEAVTFYAAIGDGPESGDQVSAGRRLLTLEAGGTALTPESLPLTFTGTAGAAGTHLLLFSAASGGTFHGAVPLVGEAVFGDTGAFRITALAISGSVAEGVEAPLAPFAVGTEVGVSTGTTLTPSSGLGTNDGTTEITLTHPITGEVATLTATAFRNRHWNETLTVNPGVGQTYYFENCLFENNLDNWCVEVSETNGRTDQMSPLAVFDHCTFDGNDSCGRALLGPFTWVDSCHVANAADGWQGAIYAVGVDSNIIGGDDGSADPHADGWQITGVGRSTLYHCWVSAGTGPGASSAVRAGTEFSSIVGIDVHYCGIDLGGFAMQFVGADPRTITDVSVIGNRWMGNEGFGPTDFGQVIAPVEWTDNAFVTGEFIPNPVPTFVSEGGAEFGLVFSLFAVGASAGPSGGGDTAPCGWDVDPVALGVCSSWPDLPEATQDAAMAMAELFLWAATARQFGVCTVTVRPSQDRCGTPELYQAYPVWPGYGDGAGAPYLFDGRWFNPAAGARCCGAPGCAVVLPGPVVSVTEVVVDGVTVNPSAYRVDVTQGTYLLVRQDGQCWPVCNRAPGDFEITYQAGRQVPYSLAVATALLACEYSNALTGQACALPARMTSLTRQGVQVEVAPPEPGEGLTGIREVDDVITALNPSRRQQAPIVLSPDMPGTYDRMTVWNGAS